MPRDCGPASPASSSTPYYLPGTWVCWDSISSSSTELHFDINDWNTGGRWSDENQCQFTVIHCKAFMAGCSSAEPWWDADSWVDDRLRPCKLISLMTPSHIFYAELSVRDGVQRRRHNSLFCWQTTLTSKEPKSIIKILVGASTILKQGYNDVGGLGDSY